MVAVNEKAYREALNHPSGRDVFHGLVGGLAAKSNGLNRKRLVRGLASKVLMERAYKKAARAYAEYVAEAKAKGDGKILEFLKWLIEFAVKEILPIILPLFV